MPLNPGRLKQRVTIQINDVQRAGPGNVDNWTDVATVWAEVLPANGGEAFRQGIERQTQFYRITMRYRTDVSPDYRIVWRGKQLDIRTCDDPEGLREAILITAESGVPT